MLPGLESVVCSARNLVNRAIVAENKTNENDWSDTSIQRIAGETVETVITDARYVQGIVARHGIKPEHFSYDGKLIDCVPEWRNPRKSFSSNIPRPSQNEINGFERALRTINAALDELASSYGWMKGPHIAALTLVSNIYFGRDQQANLVLNF